MPPFLLPWRRGEDAPVKQQWEVRRAVIFLFEVSNGGEDVGMCSLLVYTCVVTSSDVPMKLRSISSKGKAAEMKLVDL